MNRMTPSLLERTNELSHATCWRSERAGVKVPGTRILAIPCAGQAGPGPFGASPASRVQPVAAKVEPALVPVHA